MVAAPSHLRGFSLLELAVVLVIISLLSAGAITALHVQTERKQQAEAQTLLTEARESLISYAVINGVLPCPDHDADGNPDACGKTGVEHGGLPWKLLALPAKDPWGQTLHYAVHTNFATGKTISLNTTSNLEIQSKDASGTISSLADEASVVMALWSTGPNTNDNSRGSTDSKLIAESPTSDDTVIWLSRFVMIGRMLEAGRDIAQ
ncbi:MAG: hypothetical protein H6R19_3356 [Proteobacteria bacterium]|nr:hypothetical protein [Pseudomonadota bacterium]